MSDKIPEDILQLQQVITDDDQEETRVEAMGQWLVKLAKTGAAIEPHQMCGGCAFKAGTEANGDADTVWNASNCVAFGMGHFLCHESEEESLCAGFVMANANFKENHKRKKK